MAAKPIHCKAGEWTKLVSNFGSGYARTFEVHLTAANGGPIEGEFEERRAWWIFPQSPQRGPLAPEMQFHRKWINAIYSIRIKPSRDVTAIVR
jgi:hypothetical protein